MLEEKDTSKNKINWRIIVITVVVALFTAGTVGGGVWYYMDQNTKSTQSANDKTTKDLQKQIDLLNNKVLTTATSTPTTVDGTAGWKTYTDSGTGLTFKYPESLAIANESNYKTSNTINIKVEKIADIQESYPLGLDRATAIKDKAAVSSGDPSVNINGSSFSVFRLLKVDGAVGKEGIVTSVIDVCSTQLNRTAYIYYDDYRLTIGFNFNITDLENNNPSYFKTDPVECSGKMWAATGGGNFITDLMAGKTDKKTQDWYKDFDKTISTLNFK